MEKTYFWIFSIKRIDYWRVFDPFLISPNFAGLYSPAGSPRGRPAGFGGRGRYRGHLVKNLRKKSSEKEVRASEKEVRAEGTNASGLA
jgi:hypothetical protein